MKTTTAISLCFLGLARGFVVGPSRPLASSVRRNDQMLRMAAAGDADDKSIVCLVTGASRGIGLCIANELATDPRTKMVINYIEPEKENAEEEVENLKKMGKEAMCVQADCSKPEEIKVMFEEIQAEFGHVDCLVNNAGITRDNLVMRMKPNEWQSVIDLNLSGVYYVSEEFLRLATEAERKARVVNIASVVGQIGNPGQANYAAAKAGVIGLTKSMGKEYARQGITVNAVCPGFIETPMTAKLGEEYLQQVSDMIPMGRLGKPEEVAGMVRFLALDPAADYMTGHCFDVDGGIAIAAA